jgi:hypothetical protein
MEWCFQCGVEGRPSKAVGVDEDGEPACSGHQVKEIGADLNAAAASRTAVSAPIGFGKKSEAAQIKPAAPSPVQIKQEKEMKTFKPRTCVCGCNEAFEPTGTTQRFKEGHKPAKAKLRTGAKKPRNVPLHLRVDEGAAGGCSQSAERVIILQLGESKVQKLLDLLLQ